jgi:hypothetical protein
VIVQAAENQLGTFPAGRVPAVRHTSDTRIQIRTTGVVSDTLRRLNVIDPASYRRPMRDVPRWVLWIGGALLLWVLVNGIQKIANDFGLSSDGCPPAMNDADRRSFLGVDDYGR